MNVKSRAELLKKFIEICDTEIFPDKHCTVYVFNKSFFEGGETASYNNTKYLKMLLNTPLILFLFLFVFAKILFLIKRNSDHRKNIIFASHAIKSIKIGFKRESYFVIKRNHLLGMDLVKLASIACHEVRHRVQYCNTTISFFESKRCYENAELLKSYELGRLRFIKSLYLKKIKEECLENEADAYFIQNIITKRLKNEFPDGNFSITEFRIFVRKNKDLLIWKNSYL